MFFFRLAIVISVARHASSR